MRCAICNRTMERCICPDADERLTSLRGSPYLAIDFDAIMAQRLLNRFDIARDRAALPAPLPAHLEASRGPGAEALEEPERRLPVPFHPDLNDEQPKSRTVEAPANEP